MSKRVYLIELDLEDKDLKTILSELDKNVRVRSLNSSTLDEYDTRREYDEMLGA